MPATGSWYYETLLHTHLAEAKLFVLLSQPNFSSVLKLDLHGKFNFTTTGGRFTDTKHTRHHCLVVEKVQSTTYLDP
jgi:hypothetical protein